MDPTIRLPLVLGKLRVVASELSAAEWASILDHALRICGHHLKYLPGFTPLSERLCIGQSYDRWLVERIAATPEGRFTPSTRHRHVALLQQEVDGECASGFGARRVFRRELLLTQDGEWVTWEVDYLRHVEHGKGYRGHHSGVIAQAEVAAARLTTNEQLASVIEGCLNLGNLVLRSLYRMAKAGVEEKRQRLESTQVVETALQQLCTRINFQ